MKREGTLQALRERPDVDALIIGAGVNGIAVFRELALQGLRVLLVDKGDFCSGTSAASSHMMHGGLRYLENGEFRLVREALLERNRLLRNAPHHVKPLPTTMPLFNRFSGLLNAPLNFLGLARRPATRGALVVRIGLLVYDWFTRQGRALPTHRFSGREEALQFAAGAESRRPVYGDLERRLAGQSRAPVHRTRPAMAWRRMRKPLRSTMCRRRSGRGSR